MGARAVMAIPLSWCVLQCSYWYKLCRTNIKVLESGRNGDGFKLKIHSVVNFTPFNVHLQ